MRSGPGTNYGILTVLHKDAIVRVLGKQDNWYEIEYAEGETGYISATYLEIVDNTEEKPNFSEGKITTDFLTIHAGAGTSYSSVGTLYAGDEIEVLSTVGEWMKIKHGSVTGYVMLHYVQAINLPAGVPMRCVTDFNRYDYEKMLVDIDELMRAYPGMILKSSIGKTPEGRDIILLRVGTGEKKILMSAAMHAREYIAATHAMKSLDEMLFAHANNASIDGYDVKTLLKNTTYYIVPMLNPDGINVVINGINSSSNASILNSMNWVKEKPLSLKANTRGVDLNRNFPERWSNWTKGQSGPASELYKGPSAASEPETQAIVNLVENNTFSFSLSFHAKGQILYWIEQENRSWGQDYKFVIDKVSASTGYSLVDDTSTGSSYGANMSTYVLANKIPFITVELCPSDGTYRPYDDSKYISNVYSRAKNVMAIVGAECDKR